MSPLCPAIGASPDAVGTDFVVEVKCPVSEETVSSYITPIHCTVISKYYAQMQLQMLLKNVKKGYFCVANSDFETSQIRTIKEVEYYAKFIKETINKAMIFGEKNLFPKLLQSVMAIKQNDD